MIGKINGTNIHLNEDQLPAFTLSIQDLTDPSKIRGTRSSTIRAVNTKELRRALVSERMSDPRPTGRAELVIGNGDVASFKAQVIPVDVDRNEAELIAVGGMRHGSTMPSGPSCASSTSGSPACCSVPTWPTHGATPTAYSTSR